LGVGQIFHYRVRALSKTNVYSDWTSVVSATTSSVPGPILSILNSQISSSQLVPELAAEIDSLADTNLAVVEQGTEIDGLNAQYTVKIQADGYVSGYGLATTPVNGIPTSSFVVLANNFAFAIPGSVVRYPFVAGLVNGASTVGVNGALVVDGTITASAINTNGLVIRSATGVPIFGAGTNLDVSYVQGLGGFATLNQITDVNSLTYIANGALTRAQIGALNVGTADIQELAVTNGKIGALAVNSLKIQNQSVIVPLSVTGPGSQAFPNNTSWFTVLQGVMVLDSSFNTSVNPTAGLMMWVKGRILGNRGSNGTSTMYVQLVRITAGGVETVLVEAIVSNTYYSGQPSPPYTDWKLDTMLFDQPSAGTFTYQLRARFSAGPEPSGWYGFSFSGGYLAILGAKK